MNERGSFFSDYRIGARHDGNPNGAGDCPAFDGFIMTGGLMLHENGFEWSSCSINAFYNFIKYAYIDMIRSLTCMRDTRILI